MITAIPLDSASGTRYLRDDGWLIDVFCLRKNIWRYCVVGSKLGYTQRGFVPIGMDHADMVDALFAEIDLGSDSVDDFLREMGI